MKELVEIDDIDFSETFNKSLSSGVENEYVENECGEYYLLQ